MAVLAAWGIDRYHACARRKQRDTVNRVIRQIERSNPDHRAVGPALALLKENRHKVAFSPAILAAAETRDDFPDTLYKIVFAGVDVPRDDGIEALLRMVITAAWQELRQEDDYHKVLVQESVTALERDLADGFSRIEARLSRVETRIDDIGVALDSVATANRDLLEALASRFRIADAFDLPDSELRRQLHMKAEEYRTLLATIDALDDRVAAVANLKGAAKDAAARADFDEVEALLSRVDEVETESRTRTGAERIGAQKRCIRPRFARIPRFPGLYADCTWFVRPPCRALTKLNPRLPSPGGKP
ncbi:MAG: hypothetical protein ACOCYW_08830 [Roseicyclus sp.]